MTPAFRYALLLIASVMVMVISSLMFVSASYVDGMYGPANTDAFYHARRILDVVMTGQPVMQFDPKIHVPEGSWITWPWAYDSALAHITRLFGPFADENAASRVLMKVPVALGVVYMGFVLLLARLLRLPFFLAIILAFGTAGLPVLHAGFAVGEIDHHGAESLWTAMTLCAGMWFFSTGQRLIPGVLLGVVLGTALGVHNSMFILQLPVVGFLVLSWLRKQPLPARRQVIAFSTSLAATTLAICIPSQPWQHGLFEFYTLSWFHTYIAGCAALFSALVAFVERKPVNIAWVAALALLATIPIIGGLGMGSRFMSGALDSIQGIVEIYSPYELYVLLGDALSTRLYSWLLWASAPLMIMNVYVVYKSHDADIRFFSLMAAFGLALLQLQYRFHVFGELALIATPLVLGKLAMDRWPAHAGKIAAATATALLVAFIPTRTHYTLRWMLGNYAGYKDVRSAFPVLSEACKRRPGTVLTSLDGGHWTRYHTDCPVIGNAFLLTAQHAAKAQETNVLLNSTPEQVLESPLGISYVLVHHSLQLWPGRPEPDLEQYRPRMPLLEARLLGPLDAVPARYKLLWTHETPAHQVFGRLFEIVDPGESQAVPRQPP